MEEMDFRPRPAVLVLWLIWAACGSLPIAGIGAGICFDAQLPLLVGFGIGGFVPWAAFSLYAALYFYSIRYHLDERYVTKSSGVIWKKRRSIPLEKITNIDVRQGPFERWLGFGQIWIFTPSTGAATPEEKLIGVSTPHEMKETIVQRSQSPAGTSVPAGSAAAGLATDAGTHLLEDIRESLLRIEELLKSGKTSG